MRSIYERFVSYINKIDFAFIYGKVSKNQSLIVDQNLQDVA